MFPFIFHYTVTPSKQTPEDAVHKLKTATISSMKASSSHYQHDIKNYEEVVTIANPTTDVTNRHPASENGGFIISVFKVPYGDDKEKFERHWMSWTGKLQSTGSLTKQFILMRWKSTFIKMNQ